MFPRHYQTRSYQALQQPYFTPYQPLQQPYFTPYQSLQQSYQAPYQALESITQETGITFSRKGAKIYKKVHKVIWSADPLTDRRGFKRSKKAQS